MKREKPRRHLTATQSPRPKEEAARNRLFLALLFLALVALWQSPTYGQADRRKPVPGPAEDISVGLLGFQDETGTNARSGVCKIVESAVRQALFDRGLKPKWVESANPGPVAALTADQLAAIGSGRGVKFVVRGSVSTISFDGRPGEVRTSVRVEAEVVSVETALARSVTAESSAVGRLKDQEPLPTMDSVDLGNRDFASSSSGQAVTRALSNAGNRLAELINDVVMAPAEDVAEDTETVEEQPQDDSITQDETPVEDAEVTESQDEAYQTGEDDTADNEEDLQQLIAQAEEAVSGSRNVDPADVERLRQSLEQLLQSLENKSRLLEAGDIASTEQADQAIDAERTDLQEAVEEAYADEDFEGPSVSEASPTTRSLFERVSEYVGLTFNVIQKIQELRSTFRQAQEDYAATETETAWDQEQAPQDQAQYQAQEVDEPVEESLSEVSGVVTEEGQPVEGAVITEPLSEQTVTTDETGSYTLEDIPPRSTKLLVSKAGRSLAEGILNLSPGRKAIADFTLGSKRLSGGSRLVPGARILPSAVTLARKVGGTSFGNVSGVVQDSQGKPVPRALVQLKGLSVARTDSKGRYTFNKVPAGSHLLTALKTGLAPRTETVQIQPRKTSAINIKVAQASPLFRPHTSLFDKKADPTRTAALRGQVMAGGNRPVVGAKVSLSAARKSKAVSVRTRTDGRYELRGLHPDSYRVVVTRVGYKDFVRSVSLDAGKSVTGNFRLTEGTSDNRTRAIERVVRAMGEVRGFVRDANRKGLAGAAVALKRTGGSVVSQISTDTKGKYVLKALPGSYQLNVRKQGLRDASATIVLRSREPIKKDFELAPRRSGLPGDLPHGGLTGQLRGRVREEASGKAIRNALVSVQGRKTRTDPSGNFTVSSLPVGSHRVSVAKEGYLDRVVQVSIRNGGVTQKDFVLEASPSRQIGGGKARSGGLTGRVTDERGRPLIGVRVSIGGRAETTDRQGTYSISDLAPGSYRVTVSKPRYLSETRSVTIRADQTATANFGLAAKTTAKTR